MKGFATGLLAGSVLGAIGIGMVMTDSRTRKKFKKKAVKRANDLIDNVTDMF